MNVPFDAHPSREPIEAVAPPPDAGDETEVVDEAQSVAPGHKEVDDPLHTNAAEYLTALVADAPSAPPTPQTVQRPRFGRRPVDMPQGTKAPTEVITNTIDKETAPTTDKQPTSEVPEPVDQPPVASSSPDIHHEVVPIAVADTPISIETSTDVPAENPVETAAVENPKPEQPKDEPDPTPALDPKNVKSLRPIGHRAVAAASEAAQLEDYSADKAQELAKVQAEDLQLTREIIARVKDIDADDCSWTFREEEWPPGLQGLVEASAPQGGWPKDATLLYKLKAKDQNGEPVIKDDTLLNLLEWHSHNFEQIQEKFVQEDLPQHVAATAEFVEKGIREQWLPPVAAERFRQFCENTIVYLDDGSGTVMDRTHAYFIMRKDTMYLGQPDSGWTFTHEGIHAIAISRNEQGQTVMFDSSLRLVMGEVGERLMDEAITEHLTLVATGANEDLHTIWPSENCPGSYHARRRFLDVICRYGKGKQAIDVRYFIDAMFEGSRERAERGQDSAEVRLRRELNRAHPNFPELRESINKVSEWDNNVTLRALTIKLRDRTIRPSPYAYEEDFVFAPDQPLKSSRWQRKMRA